MPRLLREPLLHFVLLGAGLFALHGWLRAQVSVDAGSAAGSTTIEIGAGTIGNLAELWRRQWGRSPTEEDLRGLVQAHVREEALYREAMAIGLERDDTIIRRRLAQKMEFLFADLANPPTPDDATLEKFLAENAAKYLEPPRVTFEHIYFSREKRGEQVEADARLALIAVQEGSESPAEMGDSTLLAPDFTLASAQEIASQFGQGFADSLIETPPGGWRGPVESEYGLHLVNIAAKTEPRRPELAEVREQLIRDYINAKREEANQLILAEILARYAVTIDEDAIRAAAARDLADAGQ